MSIQTKVPLWHEAQGLRIWRAPHSDFYGDEIATADSVYTDEVFQEIASGGFNAVWLRGRLRELMSSNVLPELNDPQCEQRRESLRRAIARGKKYGVSVYLFFNEPLALHADDPFWQTHPELAGQPNHESVDHIDVISLCTSHETVKAFMRDAIDSVFQSVPEIGGVLLITASEHHSHCWSHHARYSLNDDYAPDPEKCGVLACPRCRDREPADIVGELVTFWRDAARQCTPEPRVLCWNWSWSMWYPDPQTPVLEKLPEGVGLQIDFERGMNIQRNGGDMYIDEYSLSVVGPSDRFRATKAAVADLDIPIYAKMQLGTTHEIATVPNLPLIPNVHAKMVRLSQENVAGIMGTWNFGCTLTLNTAAVHLYCQDPQRYHDADVFLDDLARNYFGCVQTQPIRSAWDHFCQAFNHYPFSIKFVYAAPINYAPAFPLALHYDAKPLGPAWIEHTWGDQADSCLPPGISLNDVIAAFTRLTEHWTEGLEHYRQVLTADSASPSVTPDQLQHRQAELSCAEMIAIQMQSTANIFRFQNWRLETMSAKQLSAPCDIPLDDQGQQILQEELANATKGLEFCKNDNRLGYHQECQAYMYSSELIEKKIVSLKQDLEHR